MNIAIITTFVLTSTIAVALIFFSDKTHETIDSGSENWALSNNNMTVDQSNFKITTGKLNNNQVVTVAIPKVGQVISNNCKQFEEIELIKCITKNHNTFYVSVGSVDTSDLEWEKYKILEDTTFLNIDGKILFSHSPSLIPDTTVTKDRIYMITSKNETRENNDVHIYQQFDFQTKIVSEYISKPGGFQSKGL